MSMNGPLVLSLVALLAISGLFVGLLIGRRRIAALQRQHLQRAAAVRNHVLPILEERANLAGLPTSLRAHELDDPLEASIAIGRAIRELEAHRDLPYSDTLELEKIAPRR